MHMLLAYVGSGPADPTPLWKWAYCTTFGEVYRGRPLVSRFAVVEDPSKQFVVIDLLEVQLNDDWETFTIPDTARRVFPTLEAALMSATINL